MAADAPAGLAHFLQGLDKLASIESAEFFDTGDLVAPSLEDRGHHLVARLNAVSAAGARVGGGRPCLLGRTPRFHSLGCVAPVGPREGPCLRRVSFALLRVGGRVSYFLEFPCLSIELFICLLTF